MKQNTPTFLKLVANLKRYYRKEKTLATVQGLMAIFIVMIPAVFMSTLALALLPGKAWRLACLIALSCVLLIVGLIHGGRTLRSFVSLFRPDMADVALRVGALYANVDDRLVNALQLYENYERDEGRYSVDLIEASLAKIEHLIGDEQFSSKVNAAQTKSAGQKLAILVALSLLPGLLFSSFFSVGLARLLSPAADVRGEEKIDFVVVPGDASVIKGQDLRVRAWLSDSSAMSLTLHFENPSGQQQLTLQRSMADSFSHTFPNIRDTLNYSFSLRDIRSRVFSVYPIERPMLRSLQVRVDPPAYAGIESSLLDENIGDIYALKGSRIKLAGIANKELDFGYLLFSDDRRSIDVQDRRISADFIIRQNDTYSINLTDDAGHSNAAPITYQITVMPDNAPFVQIVTPGRDIDLADDMLIPLAIEAQDDFGISKLQLAHQLLPGGEGEPDSARFALTPIRGFAADEEELRIAFNWDLSQQEMFPTDVLVYYVQAFDNDDISGPKSSRSAMYRARFPSLYEMYEEFATEQDDVTDAFAETLEKNRELQKKFDQLSLDMKRTSDMDWQQKQEIEQAVEQQKEIDKNIQELTQKMESMVEKITKNDLFTPETATKLQEIQQLYQEIMTPELQTAMEKMAEALQNLDEEMIRQAMEEIKLNAEEYEKTLDRTISLLKKLKAEQKLDQALKMAHDLQARQSSITEGAQRQPDHQRLHAEQERISRDSAALSDLLNELQRESQDIPTMPNQQINDAAAEMQSQNLQDNLTTLQDLLARNLLQNVPQKSSQAAGSFENIAAQLDMAKQLLSGQMQQEALKAMRKSQRELLQLSKRQEKVMHGTKSMPLNSAEFPDQANQQQQIAAGLERVADDMSQAMKENFGMDPQVSRSLGQAMMSMDDALAYMESRNAANASVNQGNAMMALNAAVRQLQQSMQNMQQQGGGGGMSYQQFLQQMQQMGDSQSQINQQSQALGSEGMLTLGQQAAMARLAAEQRQVRKSMEQLAREAAGMSEVLGSLDHIAEEMKKVEDDFVNQNITRDTINRQNRILSRMLDAQKSVHQREFSRERQAERGKDYVTRSPDELPPSLGERENQLDQALMRAKKEGYTRDYLEVIEHYFKALTEYEMSQE